MVELQPNRCYVCKKLFCCTDCCLAHIKAKHPDRELNCPLCRSEFLVVQRLEDSDFLSHVVVNHLPLQCNTCGDCYETGDELKTLGACSLRLLKPINPLKNLSSNSVNITPPLNQTPSNSVTPKDRYSVPGYNHKFETLTSPPEFTRHTSTPMHIGLCRQNSNLNFKTPKSPNISLKTPNTPQVKRANEEGNGKTETPHIQKKLSGRDSNLQELLEQSESIYLSFSPTTKGNFSDKVSLKSILSNKSMMAQSPPEHRPELSATQADMELTQTVGFPAEANQEMRSPPDKVCQVNPEVRDSGRRVRFSDQFGGKRDGSDKNSKIDIVVNDLDNSKIDANSSSNSRDEGSSDKSDINDTEEFFEARQSLSEFTTIHSQSLENSRTEVKENEVVSSTSELGSPRKSQNMELSRIDFLADEVDGNKENEKECSKKSGDTENENISGKTNGFTRMTKLKESSRVVMMVLVEKTGDTSLDLKPIIDSGLRTLESVRMNSGKDDFRRCDGQELVLAVDSYKTISTVECFNVPQRTQGRKDRNQGNERDERIGKSEKNEKGSNVGLLSAVANAVKTAFKNISDAVSTRPSVGDTSGGNTQQDVPKITVEPPSFVQELLASSPPARAQKRSRDVLMSFDCIQSDEDNRSDDIRSPEQKRQRGWYTEIRPREPIARMRSEPLLSSSDIAKGNRIFRVGSLAAGDSAFFPLRPQKSTETEK